MRWAIAKKYKMVARYSENDLLQLKINAFTGKRRM